MALVNVQSWHRFVVQRFSVAPEILGKMHCFEYAGQQVRIVVPVVDKTLEGKHDLERVRCWKWKKVDGVDVPKGYHVVSIDLYIKVPQPFDVPDSALQVSPKRTNLFSEQQVTQLDSLIGEHEKIASQAFAYWLRVLRWKARIPHIGEPEVSRERSGWSSYFEVIETGHRFWSGRQMLHAQISAEVTIEQWEVAQIALSAELTPPIWFDFLFEAIQRLNNGDELAAILSAAIGLEAIMRSLFSKHLSPETFSEPIVQEVFDLTNLRAIVNRRRKMSFWKRKGLEQVWREKEFQELLNCRDAIMHRAKADLAGNRNLRTTFNNLLEFAYVVDEKIFSVTDG
jgi:hypothetical protein